ncbi:hypothetical protein SAMN05216488_1610 [Microbacterium sp. LKL04]|uniref:Uncharacterized protein n=1 Tax=Microbacterium oleivorans TaxID=273677 RepID=A0A4R5YG56_9MICO|nr:hypothetical protein [Microbacterium]MDQ1125160.1 putative membrane protein YdfJ with MMPL/SSD domain [Microbacterium sp. SORGH_AS_0505]TDL44172.1 hypothetical protein E2R54_13510 [Microbacterium oleivorans]SCY38509.1 hypothetical protein SAMN05216488_1610 [Microbacterium sp. LKL04]
MATATLTTTPRSRASVGTTTRAAVLSVLGTVLAIGIAATSLLVVPVALLVAFGPSLLSLF